MTKKQNKKMPECPMNKAIELYHLTKQLQKNGGILSEGMILCAEDAEGNLALMTPEKDMPAGAEIC